MNQFIMKKYFSQAFSKSKFGRIPLLQQISSFSSKFDYGSDHSTDFVKDCIIGARGDFSSYEKKVLQNILIEYEKTKSGRNNESNGFSQGFETKTAPKSAGNESRELIEAIEKLNYLASTSYHRGIIDYVEQRMPNKLKTETNRSKKWYRYLTEFNEGKNLIRHFQRLVPGWGGNAETLARNIDFVYQLHPNNPPPTSTQAIFQDFHSVSEPSSIMERTNALYEYFIFIRILVDVRGLQLTDKSTTQFNLVFFLANLGLLVHYVSQL